MKKTVLLFIIYIFMCLKPVQTNAQFKNNREAAFYDMGIGALVGGIGAIINKKPKEKIGNVFLKGLWQGALGGYFVFESKRLISLTVNKNSYNYFWPSKIVNSVGNSILENAAANKNFWEQYHINVGFNRFEFDMTKKGKFCYKVMPFSLYLTIENFTLGNFDAKKSLKTGTFIFEAKNALGTFTTDSKVYNISGWARGNQVLYDSSFLSNETIPHEIIHTYQYEQLVNFNSLFFKPKKILTKKFKAINFYTKYFYTDFNQAIYYNLNNLNKNYQTNFYEQEARFYTE